MTPRSEPPTITGDPGEAPFEISVCAACERPAFPPRPLCPTCGGRRWESRVADRGVVEARTWRFHRTREERRLPVVEWWDLRRVPLAFVRLDLGPVVIARSSDDAAIGTTVRLVTESGVPIVSAI